ncbi:hypothetical protein GGR56DRAFT_681572 [Xylariaceae sp. FL0804]|nr:hypothetical protein GGR56DRAFT_681572 [Xylariaceae sp. FL0804]
MRFDGSLLGLPTLLHALSWRSARTMTSCIEFAGRPFCRPVEQRDIAPALVDAVGSGNTSDHRNLTNSYVKLEGSIDEGITTTSWSPGEELMAIATTKSNMVVLARRGSRDLRRDSTARVRTPSDDDEDEDVTHDRLLGSCGRGGPRAAMTRAVYRAYWVDGVDISDRAAVLRVARLPDWHPPGE